jgi:hypothetical protein
VHFGAEQKPQQHAGDEGNHRAAHFAESLH